MSNKTDYPLLSDITEKNIDFKSLFDYTEEEAVVLDYISEQIDPPEYLFSFTPEYKYTYDLKVSEIIDYAKERSIKIDDKQVVSAIISLKTKNSNALTHEGHVTGISALRQYIYDENMEDITVIIDARIIKALDKNTD